MEWDGDPEDAFYIDDKQGRQLRLIPFHADEVRDALERLAIDLDRTKSDLGAWKWAMIAAHNAVQNAMADTVPFPFSGPEDLEGALEEFKDAASEEDKSKAMDKYTSILARRIRNHEPTGYLDGFRALWKAAKAKRGIAHNPGVDQRLNQLNRERNKFIHFGGEVANFDLRDYPQLVLTALEVTEFLGWNNNFMNWGPGDTKAKARRALDHCLALARELVGDYGV